MTATLPNMIGLFNMENLELLQTLGAEVHVACNFEDRSIWTEEKVENFKEIIKERNIKFFQVDYARSPYDIRKIIKAFHQLYKIAEEEQYDLIHCHAPVSSVISRMVGHALKIKVMYTAHGFHFYKGAPKKNWLLYYPIEKVMSLWTDVLVTICKEDYKRASEKFSCKKIIYIPGIGIDVKKIEDIYFGEIDRASKRNEFGIEESDFVVLSVGELNRNKNHEVIIKAIKRMQSQNIKYLICGHGELKEYLERLIHENKLDNQVKLLGYRNDILALLKIADVYAHPSLREGISVAIMEAMASGKPVVCGNIRGNRDLIDDGKGGLLVPSNEYYEALYTLINNREMCKEFGRYNKEKAQNFDIGYVMHIMSEIYRELLN